MPITVERTKICLAPDSTRVLLKSFIPGDKNRMQRIFNRILTLTDQQINQQLEILMKGFQHRHKNFKQALLHNYEIATKALDNEIQVSDERRQLFGAFFSNEYSIESAAFFNPSMVPHDDQNNIPEGATHFIMSFRAVGEGHISSIAFRTGIIDKDNEITINPVSRFIGTGKHAPNKKYNKIIFRKKLTEIGCDDYVSDLVVHKLDLEFDIFSLKEVIGELCDINLASTRTKEAFDDIISLAETNYAMDYDPNSHICERVLFPFSHAESKGIEDARFVQFFDEDGSKMYYATYTAYSGNKFMPQLLKTPNFINFESMTLNGAAVQNKGMALFPRKIGGLFMMISRQDNESLYIMTSDNINFWGKAELLYKPSKPWEMVQIGNCGSPIETPEGWILLTHGVGAMRQYCIGAILLDLKDPFRVIGSLKEPFLVPTEEERDGYVPNALYACGAMQHNDVLVIPYAMSDYKSSIALVNTKELVHEMKSNTNQKERRRGI